VKQFVAWLQATAITLGGPGLFVIGFLDSSFLSFPEVNDLLVMGLVMEHPHRLLYYSSMATLGSVAGCFALYSVAKRGGQRFVEKRFKPQYVAAGRRLFEKYGILVIMVPALLPPPAPFKIFVLLAGIAGLPAWQFLIAVASARFVRYFGEGLLAVWYGDRAIVFLHAHAKEIGLILAGLALVGGVAYVAWKKRKRV
jgi:LPXTG-motif cell wall-anchored protein